MGLVNTRILNDQLETKVIEEYSILSDTKNELADSVHNSFVMSLLDISSVH